MRAPDARAHHSTSLIKNLLVVATQCAEVGFHSHPAQQPRKRRPAPQEHDVQHRIALTGSCHGRNQNHVVIVPPSPPARPLLATRIGRRGARRARHCRLAAVCDGRVVSRQFATARQSVSSGGAAQQRRRNRRRCAHRFGHQQQCDRHCWRRACVANATACFGQRPAFAFTGLAILDCTAARRPRPCV